ncbi:MAG: penicillin-binding transpeptidase domain-containing protein, partial [Planctomycetota bacterium]
GFQRDEGTNKLILDKDGNPIVEYTTVGELGGKLADAETQAGYRRGGLYKSNTIFLGIGQGDAILWTPLQAANAYAILARRGRVEPPSLLGDRSLRPDPSSADAPPIGEPVQQTILSGLRQSVSEGGTGYHIVYEDQSEDLIFSAPGVTVWGKTGTAQAPAILIDADGDGEITDEEKKSHAYVDVDHAWFVGLVGPTGERADPRYAIAVIVEYGGSGGRVAGPIADQIIRLLQQRDYLPTGDAS